jgi:long-chain acyl-CoA synthetase
VTLDPEVLESWKLQHGRPAGATPGDLAGDPELIAEIQRAVDEANKAVSRAESVRRFRILDTDFTEASGQLTPSLKVRRNVVAKDFAADIEALYSLPRLQQVTSSRAQLATRLRRATGRRTARAASRTVSRER